MSVGMIVLLVLSLLVIFGVGQRVLDRMRINDKTALLVMLAIFIGGLIPSIKMGRVEIGIGGCLVPLALCVWVLAKSGSWMNVIRALFGSLLTAAAVWLVSLLMPAEPEQIVLDPNYAYGLCAGIIAYLLNRSRRNAFISGVLGVLLADTTVAVINWQKGIEQTLRLGTAGALDAVVISGLIAVLLSEFMGEWIERMVRGRKKTQ